MINKTLGSWYFVLCTLCMAFCTSCSEKDEAGEYDNWKERNEHYLDSIASVAKTDDSWTKIKAYTLGDSLDLNGPNIYYIYVQKLEAGTGDYSPQQNDTVRVHYSVRYIPTEKYPSGYVFNKSFRGTTLNESVDVPMRTGLTSVVVGFATALMHMVQGDSWRVVVPYYLGYGDQNSTATGVPAYSTLIFEMKLARVYRYKIDTDSEWR